MHWDHQRLERTSNFAGVICLRLAVCWTSVLPARLPRPLQRCWPQFRERSGESLSSIHGGCRKMTDQPIKFGTYQWFEETSEDLPLDSSEIEVRLAIAEFVIRRVAGTPAGEDIFNGLLKLFENRYPHHKLLSHYLISPGCLVPEAEDVAVEAAAEEISLGGGAR